MIKHVETLARKLALALPALLLALTALGVPRAASANASAPANVTAAAPVGGIEAMSCLGPKSCIGLGTYATPVHGVSAFLRTWNGTAWGPIRDPLHASASDGLNAISCISATFCVAVGGRTTGSEDNTSPLVATWNGSRWSETVPPAPASTIQDEELTSVSCASTRLCFAVGAYYLVGNGAVTDLDLTEGFVDRWNGTKWTASYKTTPGPKDHQTGFLDEVSCRPSASCVLVGSTYQSIYAVPNVGADVQTYRPVALRWNGAKWAASTVPISSGQHGALTAVSCWSLSRCMAVGEEYASQPVTDPTPAKITLIAERWNGAHWSVATLPTSGTDPYLTDISCASATTCLTVGSAATAKDNRVFYSLADAWNGKTWRAIPVATPKDGTGKTGPNPNSSELVDVTCTSARECVAFGLAGPLFTSSALTPFAELYTGTRLSNIADS